MRLAAGNRLTGHFGLLAALTFALWALADYHAAAEEKSGCDAFSWPISREQALFSAAGIEEVASGTALRGLPQAALSVRLVPREIVNLSAAHERKSKADSPFAAVVSIAAVEKPGAYQVTLSDEAWIDVVQDGRALEATAHSGNKGCPGVRKTVRFDLAPGQAELQLSGTKAGPIRVAILPAE